MQAGQVYCIAVFHIMVAQDNATYSWANISYIEYYIINQQALGQLFSKLTETQDNWARC